MQWGDERAGGNALNMFGGFDLSQARINLKCQSSDLIITQIK